MKIKEIKNILKADVLTCSESKMDMAVIAAGSADIMSDVLSAVSEHALILTGLTDETVIRTAKIGGVSAIVFVRGKNPEPKAIELAKEYDLPLLVTEYSLFVASGRLYINGLRGLEGSW
ncbi:MAG: hypothetical protein JRJ49_05460 [Deltaproteobacteria bacterium]|jgi:predicted transcriptional regulator|nr:hypothetical protein [Deltaproteobacteria bacterium]